MFNGKDGRASLKVQLPVYTHHSTVSQSPILFNFSQKRCEIIETSLFYILAGYTHVQWHGSGAHPHDRTKCVSYAACSLWSCRALKSRRLVRFLKIRWIRRLKTTINDGVALNGCVRMLCVCVPGYARMSLSRGRAWPFH